MKIPWADIHVNRFRQQRTEKISDPARKALDFILRTIDLRLKNRIEVFFSQKTLRRKMVEAIMFAVKRTIQVSHF
jgi:hypothetical protein